MPKGIKIIAITLLAVCSSFLATTTQAFVSVPVADLMVDPYKAAKNKKLSITNYYQNMPFSGSWEACRRAHQLLFNEVVTVLEERGPEVKIKISNFYFLKDKETIPCDTYWTLRSNLTFFKDVKATLRGSTKIPPSYSYEKNNIEQTPSTKAITLKKPFYDPVTKTIYSAGTRFCLSNNTDYKGPHGKGYFEVYIFDRHSHQLKTTQIPKVNCIRNYSKKPDDKVKNFVKVLKTWAHQKEGAIPYVLGGWSWTLTCDNSNYEVLKHSDSHSAIHRKGWSHSFKSGFDCMGMIGRAAQICDVPFYIKNTTTLLKDLRPLEKNEPLEAGDIIWYPGHVMVVSCTKNNLAIEARGYDRGEGKVHEVSISSIFKEVENYQELKNFYHEKKAVTVLYYDGRPWKTFSKFKILKMKSIWEK